MKLWRRALATGCAAAVAAVALVLTVGPGQPAAEAPAADSVADAAPGYAVEDYGYPDADKILAEQDVLLKRGDGRITLAACGSETGLMEVYVREHEKVCFKVTGNSGWLTMEIPAVFGVKGAGEQSAVVDMTVESEEVSFDVPKGEFAAVGDTADPEGRDHMLVEIRTTK
ncbi:hypothetical protein ACIBI4_10020 [Streptomyces sp. NPDC050418]|uniref:hypothetical protein n=1 Tax=Streptomyces sp. NPDC050418 TaxID=3365612 RepID=UPI0037B974E9